MVAVESLASEARSLEQWPAESHRHLAAGTACQGTVIKGQCLPLSCAMQLECVHVKVCGRPLLLVCGYPAMLTASRVWLYRAVCAIPMPGTEHRLVQRCATATSHITRLRQTLFCSSSSCSWVLLTWPRLQLQANWQP